MPKTIVQKVLFKNTSPASLYELYMNAKKHTAATGTKAVISSKARTKFTAYDDYISGENILLVKDTLIVQLWRGSDWDKKEVDSTFIIHLEPKGKDTILHMVHSNLPDEHTADINTGWHDFYWKPWKQYLAGHK